jgi:hypothetical protein
MQDREYGKDGNMMVSFALLGEEAPKDFLLVEQLNQLPHHLADHREGDTG